MIINLARRAHDHNWELDPITRSLLDTDFYKLLMLQFIWKQFPKTQTSFALSFNGLWTETTMWEIYALSAVSELRTRASLKRLSEFELDIFYSRAKTKLWEKMERLHGVPGLKISDFGTRRRHSFLWQEYVVKAMSDVLRGNFTGTSNTYLAYKHDLEAIGTNAHELPMALAAMAQNDEELKTAQYRLLQLWQQTYQGELLILLPDTFGTTQFLGSAPDWVADWTGQRADSKDPFLAGDEYIAWLQQRKRDPRQKLFIASDSLDMDTILGLHAHFSGTIRNGASPGDFRQASDFLDERKWIPERRIRFSAGWGTLLTNDFRNCNPQGSSDFDPVSLVCKLHDVEGKPAVKLSDNFEKALGPGDEIQRYRRLFGLAGVAHAPIIT